MDINTYRSPISFLQENIKGVFDHTVNRLTPEIMDKIGAADIKIISDNRLEVIQPPVANLTTHEIIVQETFLSYLWSCCYAMVGLNDMVYQKAEEGKPVVTFDDIPEFRRVQLTLDWARKLKKEYTPWSVECANPSVPGAYIEGTNNLFEACVLYILFHEVGHVIFHAHQTDLLTAARKSVNERTPEEKQAIYDAEVEADQFAFDCLRVSSDREDVKFLKYLGAVIAQFSNFFLLDVPDTRGFSHPDMDTRLRSVIRQVDLKEEYHRIHFKAHCSVGLQLFMSLTKTDFIPESPEDADFKEFEDLEEYLFKRIEEIKERVKAYYEKK